MHHNPFETLGPPSGPCRVAALSDWSLLLGWAQHGKAEAHFGEAGVTNLLHLLRDSLRKATGGQLLVGTAPLAGRGGVVGRDRQQAQVCVWEVPQAWS